MSSEIFPRIDAFFDILQTPSMLTEIGAVSICLLLGWFAGAALRNRYRRPSLLDATELTQGYLASQVVAVAAPAVITLGLVILARALLHSLGLDDTMLESAMSLLGAYVVVRIGVFLSAASLGNKSWMRQWEHRVALLIWLAFAADYLGWLDPIIATLDSVGIAAGRFRSMRKL